MPASQEVKLGNQDLTAKVEPVDHSDPIYFTDESPEFKVTLSNGTEYDFVGDSAISWCVAIGEGMPSPVYSGKVDVHLPQGESREYTFQSGLLAFEGHGVVGLDGGGHSGQGDSKERKLKPGHVQSGYQPAYTFSVWDREHYEIIHGQTRRLQKYALGASILIGISAVIQVLAIFF